MKKGPAFIERPEIQKAAIIGDVHGCYDELVELLDLLAAEGEDRMLVFVGDLTDRGPKPVEVLELVMKLKQQGRALCVKGNHDEKLGRWLNGKNVQLWHGLDYTTGQLRKKPKIARDQISVFIDNLPFQLFLDRDQLLIAHAGLSEKLQKQTSPAMQSFALYGDTTGEKDELGLPVRRDWAKNYQGKRMVVYGHTPVAEPYWQGNTVNIDTGCAFGGRLTALLYPEKELRQVKAKAEYAVPTRKFLPETEPEKR